MTERKNHPLAICKTNQSDWLLKLQNATGRPVVTRLPPKTGTIIFLLDCSTSMLLNNNLHFAKKGGIEYAIEANKKGYNIGLISFGSSAIKNLDPQDNVESFINNIIKLEVDGSTNLTDAIHMAREILLPSLMEKIIFIVTDGFPDNPDSAKNEARLAAKSGIEIMTLGTDDADLNFLNLIATKKEFSNKVNRQFLQQGIKDMSKLLPGKY